MEQYMLRTSKTKFRIFRNIKSKYFSKPTKNIEISSYKSSISFPNDETSITQLNIDPSLSSKLKQSNNIIKINIIHNYIPNENKAKSFIKKNKNQNQINTDNLDENIDIDDIDEYSDIKFNINIRKPKFPFYNKNYYNYNNDSSNSSINIFNNFLKNSGNKK